MSNFKRVKKRKIIMDKLKHKYRLVFFNDNTFEEVWHLRLSLLNVLSVIGTVSIFMTTMVIVLIAFTPLREFIPGYPSKDMRREIVLNALKLDSLANSIRVQNQYIDNLNALVSGKSPSVSDSLNNRELSTKAISFTKSEADSVFRQQIEKQEQFNFSSNPDKKQEGSISDMHFFNPVKGLVTNDYDPKTKHYGIDIVASPNEVVKATLEGTVIMASWTIETGNVIQLQHKNNIVSVYKHCASLLKKEGDKVQTGDAIAIIGNSGELTTGPHLHFELWHNGKAINPKDFLVF
ncbi:MAG TPA: M23 family metallopeptidase [Bacteroidales bacterium]|nr:M23 family metallopeptidase [Bacteroidales bacterium]